jgi:hypothetical protein
MLKYLKDLEYRINSTYNELSEENLPEFKDTFDSIKKLIEDYDSGTAKEELYAVSEPVELPSSDDNSNHEDHVYKFGSIEKIESEEDESAEEAENSEESVEEDKLANPFEEENNNENPEE